MRYFTFFFATSLILFGCSSKQSEELAENDIPVPAEELASNDSIKEDTAIISPPRVLVVPCSNGYLYNSHQGDVNPFLEELLEANDQIEYVPFPYVAMKGAGYFGVYDKKHCSSILQHTDVDFLIMTRMHGIESIPVNPQQSESTNATSSWGYSTRILDVRTMEQFEGISARGLNSFDAIESNVSAKFPQLAELILEASKKAEE